MTIASLLYTRLTTYSGITAIVGARVYPLLLPGNAPTLPAITYERVSSTEQKGTSTLKDTRWQINCWTQRREGGNGYAEVHSLAAQVKAALEEWHDLDQTPGINMARMVNEFEDYEDDTKTFRIILDVMLTTTGD